MYMLTAKIEGFVHHDGASRQSHILFAVSENLRLYVIFLKENKLTSFLEVHAKFSLQREENCAEKKGGTLFFQNLRYLVQRHTTAVQN